MKSNSTEQNYGLIAILKPDGKFTLDYDNANNIVETKLYDSFLEDFNKTFLELGMDKKIELSISLGFIVKLSNLYIKKILQNDTLELSRHKVEIKFNDDEIDNIIAEAPFMLGLEHLNGDWINNCMDILHFEFCKRIREYSGTVEAFINSHNSGYHVAGKIYFHLVESKNEDFPFAFLATYATDNKDSKKKQLPLKNALVEYKEDTEKLLMVLSTVNRACESSALVYELVESGDIFHPIRFTAAEAYDFLCEIPIYESSGIICRIPNWWKRKSNGLKLSVTVGEKKKSLVNMESLVDFNAKLLLGDDEIDINELKNILLEKEGLAFIKGKWIEVNHKRLEETLKAYEKAQLLVNNNDMTMIEAMRFQLNVNEKLNISEEIDVEVTNGQWIDAVVTKLSNPNEIEDVNVGNHFNATLRPYQEKGLNWLMFMKNLGLGACLADDMGLGKTIQIIALLNACKDKNEKSLIVVPVSLIGNWISEIKKFAPNLKYYVIHNSENKDIPDDDKLFAEEYDIYITSYGMLMKYDWMKEVKWDFLILDEAQAIKNPRTKRTRAVKKIQAKSKIAMTGTPIENKLSDLWSLFDFLNTGLLGTTKEFSSFVKGSENFSNLKHVVSPFLLRRLKTDKSIISDLPDKIEMKTYSNLSKKQVILYQELVDELEIKINSTNESIKKKGIVLASIMKFKQICNHPDQYLGSSDYLEKHSGKFERLREICENIYDKRERVIVFTQFREMTDHLNVFLESIFNHKGLVLHGGTDVKKRKMLVDQFQGDDYVPFMILSIKAGGVGLNLTSANHVIHFDRWWNPSVENQATDRAFRIGQKKKVIVHKFIMKGTIEEKIDMMIEEKMQLSNDIISTSQESAILKMNNEDLINLFRLKK